ncbi:hypothetical protein Tco_1197105 [Tanacetum coccineum]
MENLSRTKTATTSQQVALDNALVLLEKRVEIGKCNMRIDPAKTQKEPTYQVVLDALALTTCYPAFLTTADVLEIYMPQFGSPSTRKTQPLTGSRLVRKVIEIDMEVFREIFQICPRLPNQDFDELPSDKEIVSFIKELGHKGDVKSITEVVVDHMYQPWRTFAAIIDKCLFRKITCLYKLRLLRAQILWGMFYKKNVDFVELLWEDFTFPIENRDHKKQEKIILGTMRFVSKFEDFQVYGALLLNKMTNQQMLDSDAYKTYLAYATSATSPKMKRKFKKPASSLKKRTLVNKKALAKVARSKGIELLSDAALLEEAQLKKASKEANEKQLFIKQMAQVRELISNQRTDSENQEANNDEEENEDEFVHTLLNYVPTNDETNDESDDVTEEEYERINEELYGDGNINLTDVEPANKEKDDEEMAVASHVNVNQEGVGNQVKDDAQATQKTEGPIPSSCISSDYATKYLNFDNIPAVDMEVVSMLDINIQHEVPRTSPLLTIPVSVIPKQNVINPPETITTASATTISSLLTSLFPHLKQSKPIPTPTTTEATTSTIAVSASETLAALQLRVTDLEKGVKEVRYVDNSTKVISTIQSEVPKAVKEYLGSSLDDAMHKVIKKNVAGIIKEHSVPVKTVKRLRQQYAP